MVMQIVLFIRIARNFKKVPQKDLGVFLNDI